MTESFIAVGGTSADTDQLALNSTPPSKKM